jgi:hypothetical protein
MKDEGSRMKDEGPSTTLAQALQEEGRRKNALRLRDRVKRRPFDFASG